MPTLRSAAVLVLLAASGCAGPPQAAPDQVVGYGTKGVESYVPADQAGSLQALMEQCRAAPASAAVPAPQSFGAACDQLRRTAHNQPGPPRQVGAAP